MDDDITIAIDEKENKNGNISEEIPREFNESHFFRFNNFPSRVATVAASPSSSPSPSTSGSRSLRLRPVRQRAAHTKSLDLIFTSPNWNSIARKSAELDVITFHEISSKKP